MRFINEGLEHHSDGVWYWNLDTLYHEVKSRTPYTLPLNKFVHSMDLGGLHLLDTILHHPPSMMIDMIILVLMILPAQGSQDAN